MWFFWLWVTVGWWYLVWQLHVSRDDCIGIYLSITALSVYLLLKKWNTYPARRITASYIGCMFILATPSYITTIHVSTWAFVDAVYAISINEDVRSPPMLALQTFCKMCIMLQYLLSDGILVRFPIFGSFLWPQPDWSLTNPPSCFACARLGMGNLLLWYHSWQFILYRLVSAYYLNVTEWAANDHAIHIVSGMLFETSSFSPLLARQYAPLRSAFILSTILCNALSISAIALRIFPMLRDSKYPNNSFKTRAGTTVYIFLQNGALYVLFGVFAAIIWSKFPSTPLDTLITVIWQMLVVRRSFFTYPSTQLNPWTAPWPSNMCPLRINGPFGFNSPWWFDLFRYQWCREITAGPFGVTIMNWHLIRDRTDVAYSHCKSVC